MCPRRPHHEGGDWRGARNPSPPRLACRRPVSCDGPDAFCYPRLRAGVARLLARSQSKTSGPKSRVNDGKPQGEVPETLSLLKKSALSSQ